MQFRKLIQRFSKDPEQPETFSNLPQEFSHLENSGRERERERERTNEGTPRA